MSVISRSVIADSLGAEVYLRDDYIVAATMSALNAEVTLDVHGSNQILVELRAVSGVLTVSFEGTIDGTNYLAIPAFRADTSVVTLAVVSPTTMAVPLAIPAGGWRRVRCRVSAYTSGYVDVVMRASLGAGLGVPTEKPPHPASLHVTVTAAVNVGATLTLPAVPGMRHYITSLKVERLYSVVGVAAATALNVTSTNLIGSPVWVFGQAASPQGTVDRLSDDYASPMQSTAQNTATTFVAPAQLQTIWRLSAWYFVAP